MKTEKLFNTLRGFDEYVGGVHYSDSLLFILNNEKDLEPLIQTFINDSINENANVIYIKGNGNYDNLLNSYKKSYILDLNQKKINFKKAVSSIKYFFSKYGHKSFVLLDDLSSYLPIIRTEKNILTFFQAIVNTATVKKSIIVSTLNRSKFLSNTIGNLKDIASISFDVYRESDNLYCSLVNLRGRYLSLRNLPLKLDLKSLKKSSDNLLIEEDILKKITNKIEKEGKDIFSFDGIYSKIFKNSSEAMLLFEWGGDFRIFNDKLIALTGYTSDELNNINLFNLFSEKYKFKALRFYKNIKAKKYLTNNFVITKKLSKNLPVEISVTSLGYNLFFAVIRDRTKLLDFENEIKKEEAKYRKILENTSVAVALTEQGKIVYANKTLLNLLNWEDENSIINSRIKDLFHKVDQRGLQKYLHAANNFDQSVNGELNLVKPDKSIITCEVKFSQIKLNDKKYIQVECFDISSTKEILKELEFTKTKLKTLIEESPIPIALVRENKFIQCNRKFIELFGYSSYEQLIDNDKSLIGYVIGKSDKLELKKGKSFTKNGSIKFKAIKNDGTTFYTECILTKIIYQGEKIDLEFYRDISEEISRENELKLRINEFGLLNKIISRISETFDLNEIVESSITSIISNLNWKIGGIYLKNEKEDFVLTSYKGFSENLKRKFEKFSVDEGIGGLLSKTQEPLFYNITSYPSYLPHKSTFIDEKIISVCFIPLFSKLEVIGFVLLGSGEVINLDNYSLELLRSIGKHTGAAITNSQSYQSLIGVKNRYETLIKEISDVLYYGLQSEIFKFVSPNIETLIGYKPKDFYRNKSLWLSIIHPDDKKVILQRNINLNNINKTNLIEYRLLPKGKAEYIWVKDSLSVIKDENGEITSINGIISDITERKNLENTLRNTEQFKSGILASIREGVVVLDKNFNFLEWNEAMYKITGIPRTEILGKNINEIPEGLFSPEEIKYFQQALQGNVAGSEDVKFNISQTQKEGCLWIRCSPLESDSGNIIGVVSIISDITKRKLLENEIKESEQILRNVIDAMGDAFILTDLKGKVLQVNREFLNLLGYKRMEAVDREFPYPWLLEEEMSRFVLWISNLRSKNFLHDFDMTWQSKNGTKISVSLSTTLLRNSYGEPIAMLNIARDITERKRLMEELEKRNKHIEAINHIIQTANKTMDFSKVFKVLADKIHNVLQYDRIEICLLKEDKNFIQVFTELDWIPGKYSSGDIKELVSSLSNISIKEKKAIVISDINVDEKSIIYQLIEDKFASLISYPLFSKGETIGTLNLYSTEAKHYSEDHLDIIKPFADQIGSIIDRIMLFKKVTDDVSYIHNLLNSIDSIVFTVDNNFKIQEVNKAWYDFIKQNRGKIKKNYKDCYLFDVIPKDIFLSDCRIPADEVLRGSTIYFSKEYVHVTPKGKLVFHLTINPMIIAGNITGLVFTLKDITELKITEEELKKRNEQLLELTQISSGISTSFNVDHIYQTVLPKIVNVINANIILLFLADSKTGDLHLKHHFADQRTIDDGEINIHPSGNIIGSVYINNEPIFISENVLNQENISPVIKDILRNTKVSALAAIPLKSADKVIGVIDIFFSQPHYFTVQEHQLLSLIGNQLGAAIENAQLYSELRTQIERLTILYELSQHLTATLDVDQVLQIVFEQLQRVVDFDEFFIKFIDESRMMQTIALHIKSVNTEKIFLPKLSQPTIIKQDSISWKVVSENIILNEIIENDNMSIHFPMASKNKVIGEMILITKLRKSFSETEIHLLRSICSLTAIALEKTKLYEETVQKSFEIQRRNKELDDFTYVVSHDLKEPLISIEGYSKILVEEFASLIHGDSAEYINSIVKASGRMKNLIDDLLTLSRVSRLKESFKPVDLKTIIDDIKIDLNYALEGKNVQLIIPTALPKVYGNETQLKIVIRNLISNAIKFTENETPKIEFGFEDYDEQKYKCFIRDNGIGIEEKYFEKIFIIFQRLHSRDEYEGTGAGLAIVKKIIEMHQGKIWVDSKIGEGSTFYFTLPKIIES